MFSCSWCVAWDAMAPASKGPSVESDVGSALWAAVEVSAVGPVVGREPLTLLLADLVVRKPDSVTVLPAAKTAPVEAIFCAVVMAVVVVVLVAMGVELEVGSVTRSSYSELPLPSWLLEISQGLVAVECTACVSSASESSGEGDERAVAGTSDWRSVWVAVAVAAAEGCWVEETGEAKDTGMIVELVGVELPI